LTCLDLYCVVIIIMYIRVFFDVNGSGIASYACIIYIYYVSSLAHNVQTPNLSHKGKAGVY